MHGVSIQWCNLHTQSCPQYFFILLLNVLLLLFVCLFVEYMLFICLFVCS